MILGKVIGTVVADARVSTMGGQHLRLVQLLDGRTLEPQGGIYVAADVTGAGEGELVMLSSGASARKAGNLRDAPVDLVIIAIIDELTGAAGVVYRSAREEASA
jgi:ethanolamine utilization protein EutN